MFGVNDYPYITPPNDPYGYAIDQCASFANWRCINDLGTAAIINPNAPNNGGGFAEYLGSLGYAVGSVPFTHDIMSLPPGVGGAGTFGHVAVVLDVLNSTTVLVEDYNWYDDGKYHQHQLNVAGAVFAHVLREKDNMDIALLTRNDGTPDPHGPGAVYLAYGARRNGALIPLVKRHIASPADEKNYTNAGLEVEEVAGFLLDRAEDGPVVQAGQYPPEQ